MVETRLSYHLTDAFMVTVNIFGVFFANKTNFKSYRSQEINGEEHLLPNTSSELLPQKTR